MSNPMKKRHLLESQAKLLLYRRNARKLSLVYLQIVKISDMYFFQMMRYQQIKLHLQDTIMYKALIDLLHIGCLLPTFILMGCRNIAAAHQY